MQTQTVGCLHLSLFEVSSQTISQKLCGQHKILQAFHTGYPSILLQLITIYLHYQSPCTTHDHVLYIVLLIKSHFQTIL